MADPKKLACKIERRMEENEWFVSLSVDECPLVIEALRALARQQERYIPVKDDTFPAQSTDETKAST